MTRRTWLLASAGALCIAALSVAALSVRAAALTLARSQPADDSLDPVRVAPDTHKIAFENAFVRLLEVRVPPGKIEPRHRHPHGLSVYLTDWDAKVTVDGRQPDVHHRKAGTFAWSDAVIHTVQNVGAREGHIFRIELKTSGGAQAADRPVAADQSARTKQLRAMAGEPDTIDDKLFVLWEYGGALRERELAKVVLSKAADPEVKALAVLVRDGHQAGMDRMVPVARELKMTLPEGPTEAELAAIDAAAALPPADLERFFLRRQRAMHAWDITVFEDYAAVAKNPTLRRYVSDVRAPLRKHAGMVVQLSNKRGIPGGLTTVPGEGRN